MGSLVAPDRLRFDYAARAPLTPEQIREIEDQVNREVLLDKPVAKDVISRDEANERGAIAFFGEKYGERVRVVTVPGYSIELCGGCHVPTTGRKSSPTRGWPRSPAHRSRHLARDGGPPAQGRRDPFGPFAGGQGRP
jgi:hypothetical protein